ncbi:PilX N-terminal domain-containing pilus assembly protein [Undibacterium cyanobacteriorum]|uniref:PilX N-terminal domain-containing pilus assembly protein n=1 Tax=Undibacterium cyanobacteriorum TaxID=3073561 RepID=A0ABY9REX2_9BURK|nr:PilX N-terminal domain-containing pilus assembly protein [Undibacterium sp. 20NA77.5]WMW79776.1 PilX N-terminal domain-containing pilus assembly protein [Undibacterium sp. 20NA77.5]
MRILNRQKGFVLPVSMIFLIVMTMLAITAIRKSTLDEKVVGNLRAQESAFQAAEKGLRFCERQLDLAAGSTNMCRLRSGSTVQIPLNEQDFNPNNVSGNFPNKWKDKTVWSSAYALTATGIDQISGVASQPQCIIERWPLPGRDQYSWPYVITSRGVGTVDTAVVMLQEIIRCGNY